MSRDSDVALDGQAMRQLSRERRDKALAEATTADDGGWTKHTAWHWQRQLEGKLLDYWPSRRKWQWDSRIYHGTDADLARFIINRTST